MSWPGDPERLRQDSADSLADIGDWLLHGSGAPYAEGEERRPGELSVSALAYMCDALLLARDHPGLIDALIDGTRRRFAELSDTIGMYRALDGGLPDYPPGSDGGMSP